MRHKYEVNRAGKELKKIKSYSLFLHYSQARAMFSGPMTSTTATEIRKSEPAIRSAGMKGYGHEYPKPTDIS